MNGTREDGVTRWAKVPAWWLLHPAMDADGFCLMAALSTYADEDGYCEPSQATLARHLKRSRPWVNRVVADLSEAGFIQKTSRARRNGGTTSCLYRLARVAPVPGDRPATGAGPSTDSPRHRRDTSQAEPEQNQAPRRGAGAEQDDFSGGVPTSSEDAAPTTVPSGWKPSEEAVRSALALRPGSDVEAHATMFVSRCRARNYRYVTERLDDAWLSWFAEDAAKAGRGSLDGGAVRLHCRSGSSSRPSASEVRLAAWASSASVPPAAARR